jgi:hypothetical protein
MAGERGASAVLFDITEDRAAAEQVPRNIQEVTGWRKVEFPGEGEITMALFSSAATAAPGADLASSADLG